MGWHTGPPSWGEMRRVLEGKPRRAGWPIDAQVGDGGDSPAWSSKRGQYRAPELTRPGAAVPYAELHAHSAYSFLDGASTPEELVEEAARLDLRAIALTDHDGLYGVVRFAEAARELDMATVFGAELSLGGGSRTDVADPPGPHLLVLDEATSSVDTRTELLIQQAMAELRRDRTSFIIAHRLSTIRDADVIVVLEAGRIVEQGSHAQLMAKRGAYWSMTQV